ncbi:hypothetical protein ACFLQG_01315 [Candidatus Zixiibacteriota bacterium]
MTASGRNISVSWYDYQSITTTIDNTDNVYLSLWWQKISNSTNQSGLSTDIEVRIVKPGTSEVTIWSNTTNPTTSGTPISGTESQLDVSSYFDEDGLYEIRLYGIIVTGRRSTATVQINWDNVVLDVQPFVANNAPTVVAGATTVSPASINKIGANSTTISTDFTDTDVPGVGAFNCTFKIKDNVETEYTLVNNQPNGSGGLTITDNGGGSYTASYTYDPGDGQVTGDYDLYFEVSDGTDNAIDAYVSNTDELTITQQYVPTVTAGATQVSPATVNRVGANTTTISTQFTDLDIPGVGAFNVTFKVKDATETEYTLVNNQPNGGGNLTITDGGGGSYTATYDWDPGPAQATGAYDLYFEVSDGTDNAIDAYVDNTDELTVIQQNAPTVVAGATTVSPASINKIGANSTTISTTFTDLDIPGVGAFTVTFKVKDNVEGETILVNALTNGSGGLTITDGGAGSYTASYDWDPGDGQVTGAYDLYFEVSDGTDNAIDAYASNTDELTITQQYVPTVTSGATQVSPATVNRVGANTTTISTQFTDLDIPGVGAFNVTFKVKDATETEYTLVNNQPNGGGNLTITDGGGGSYTATYDWDPGPAQATGAYDLYFEVSDGTDNAIDAYVDNTNELTVIQQNAPTVVAGATTVSPASINKIGANSTTISTTFTDLDIPGVGAFTVTFKVKDNVEGETILVNALTNGSGGLTITDGGAGSYTASYDWDPGDGQVTGAYDLYFEVSDGIDNAIDAYASNTDELTITQQYVPAVTAGASSVSPSTVNRVGTNSTTLSTVFTDLDIPGVGAFTVTFKVKDATETEYTVVNAETNGTGGLIITDGGGGSYTATYDWDPGPAQATGAYDLYFEVTDGQDNAIDAYVDNTDELTVIESNDPTVVAGATQVSPATVNIVGANTTTISTSFTDIDQPGVGAFTVTFKVKDNVEGETVLVNALTNGTGGLTITDGGGGSYTASYDWDPGLAQTLGVYDLYFEVSDGGGSAIDNYVDNTDELTLTQQYAPTVVVGATQVSTSPVNRLGLNTTTISTVFTDQDSPGVGAFTVTFKVREPDDIAEVTLVNAQTNGNGGLTIADLGGGDYRAEYTWDPNGTQALGLYDLYFYVTDGTDNVTDDYTNNLNELEVVEQNAPAVPPGATTVSVTPLNRYGTNSTVISTQFTDSDQPEVGAFTVTFKVKDNVEGETILVNAQTNGSGGLTITDGGGGTYTASYSWDPGDLQTLGDYDLYFEVSDGVDSDVDDYTSNTNELNLYQQVPPSVVAGATQVSQSPLNRSGPNTTTISTTFTDVDQPGVGAFTVTFKVREPDNSTEVVLVNALTNGVGGLTITDGGGGTYTASYDWDPLGTQALGLYDLYFEVSDGTDNTIDIYDNNLNELEITQQNAPTVAVSATTVSPITVNRAGANTTTISTNFVDADQPGVGAFTVTFKVQEPDNSTEVILVDGLTTGNGGLTVIDGGGGTYTASYTWDPGGSQALGAYDLYFEVSDGIDNAVDDYTSNSDELTVYQQIAPTVVADATQASPTSVNRIGSNTTTISTQFTDADQPGVNAFTVTFKVKDIAEGELTLVNALTNGNGGLTITDGGGGSYTASYDWDPGPSQTLGTYDLYFEVSDGTDNVIDGYVINADELTVVESNDPTVVAGATGVSPASLNRIGANTIVISTQFTDVDEPGVGAFNVTFKIKDASEVETILVNNQPNSGGGLTITDGGGGSYTASYTYNPDDAQPTGVYDLYFEVSDGGGTAIDNYVSNTDELTITSQSAPTVSTSATQAVPSTVNRVETNTTVISTQFTDIDQPGINAFTVTFKIKDISEAEYILVNAQTNGNGGLTITDGGGGSYTASYTWDPGDAQTLGTYDLYFEVSDGSDSDIDGYTNNLEELTVVEVLSNEPPTFTAGATSVSPSAIDRYGAITTSFSATFTDLDDPGVSTFYVTFEAKAPFDQQIYTIADGLQNGQSGMSITSGGGGSYTATIDWDPPNNAILGYYDLTCIVFDGIDSTSDDYTDNLDELQINSGGENIPPIVPAGATSANPIAIERVGANPTTISATFSDGDSPAVGVFTVTFKIKDSTDSEIVLANNVNHGTGGVTITDQGGGVYTASISWDPGDAQTLGPYDLYFHVFEGTDTSYDAYTNNIDELELYDAISNNSPTLTTGNTFALPNSITYNGSDFTMLKSAFTDVDNPGIGAFTVTFKVRDPLSAEYTIVNASTHGLNDLRIQHVGGSNYEASVLWDPPDAQETGTYDLYFYVEDQDAGSALDDYTDNLDELTVTSDALLGDGMLLRRTNDADNCGSVSTACHNIADHQSQNCLVCHTAHGTKNIYMIRETIATPNSNDQPVLFKTLGIGDPFNSPDPVAGEDTHGAMADGSNTVYTEVCEVCHTATDYYRNDGTQPKDHID